WIHNEPQQRYFLPLVCLLAITTDLIVVNLCRYYWVRVARISLIIVAMFALPIVAWPEIIKRQSNIDIITAKLNQDSGPNDLVVVNPWNLGISFQRYYNSAAKWMTVPTINEHGFHRYDLIHAKMMTEQPIADVLDAVRQTLVRGNRVWIVGGARPPEEGLPLSLPPAPDSEFGWSARVYGNVWSMQLGDFLKTHVKQGDVVISPGSDVSDTEKVPLLVAQGWQD